MARRACKGPRNQGKRSVQGLSHAIIIYIKRKERKQICRDPEEEQEAAASEEAREAAALAVEDTTAALEEVITTIIITDQDRFSEAFTDLTATVTVAEDA